MRGGCRFRAAGQAFKQGLHRVGRTLRGQEIEDDSHGSFRNWPRNAYIADNSVDELVHGPLVSLAPPAEPKHIAHYVCPYKATPEIGGDVLQIDNAYVAKRNCETFHAGKLAHRRSATYYLLVAHVQSAGLFGMRRSDQLNVKSGRSDELRPE
jgi:hypothetical protein